MDDDCGSEDRGVSVFDVLPFCEELEKFIKYVGNVRDLNFLTYKYPDELKNRLDTNVHELETMLAEVKEAFVNAERFKTQLKSVRREKTAVKRILKKMRDEEVKEMESVISLYEKPIFSRWENAKTTQKPDVLEVMLTDIKSKQHALENLTVLVTRKLNEIQAFQPSQNGEASKERHSFGTREKPAIPLPFPSFCAPLIPTPPPLPPLPPLLLTAPVSHLPKRSHTPRLSIPRRRRLERRDENLERRVVNGPPNVDDLSLVPLTLTDLASNLYPRNPSHVVVADNIGGGAIAGSDSNNVTQINIDNNGNNNQSGVRGLGMEFQTEMRTVLQALFGDLRSSPTLVDTESTSGNTADDENTANTSREIELYALRRAP